jgi:hypothetical protein
VHVCVHTKPHGNVDPMLCPPACDFLAPDPGVRRRHWAFRGDYLINAGKSQLEANFTWLDDFLNRLPRQLPLQGATLRIQGQVRGHALYQAQTCVAGDIQRVYRGHQGRRRAQRALDPLSSLE